MPALHKQPQPSFRVSRIAWLEGNIRRLHARLLAEVPPLNEGGGGHLQVYWERIQADALELLCMCAEVNGLQCAQDGSRSEDGRK